MIDELDNSKHCKTNYYNNLKKTIQGGKGRYRSQFQKNEFLTVI